MKKSTKKGLGKAGCLLILISLVISCRNEAVAPKKDLSKIVEDSVRHMMETISGEVTDKGPVGWIPFFEESPSFYMATDGELLFPDRDSALRFINDYLVKRVQKISLQWNDIRVEVLTQDLAGVSAKWTEYITDISNSLIKEGGYFTGTAARTAGGWKLRNLHWSSFKELNH